MDTPNRVQWARRLGILVVVMTLCLMVLGSWVKATNSGLSCPDWPKCYDQWLPPFPSKETGGLDPNGTDLADNYSQAQVMYEWSHRLLASLLGVPFLAWAFIAWRGKELHPGLRWTPIAAALILAFQVRLGGITVEGGNAAPLTTAHLATATVFFGLVVTAACFAFLRPLAEPPVIVEEVFAGEDA